MVCVRYNRRYHFLDKVFRTLQTINILASDLPMHAETQNFSSKKKKTKRERRASETLINNYLPKERAFYRLNERFVSNITGEIIFSARSLECFKR